MMALGLFLVIFELFVFTGCAIFMVWMLPRKTEKNPWAEIAAWGIFALLSILLPNIGRDDILTMAVLMGLAGFCTTGAEWDCFIS
ncbi:hypothetical protein AALA00_06140 [Lachnospiraceae bacterium 46-15]